MTADRPIERSADVVVIGAGIVGSATAYYLARRGVRAVVVERGAGLGSGFGDEEYTAAHCVVHAVEHAQEHLGQAYLTRQLWEAQRSAR